MTVRYMIVTDELDGTTTHAVVATLDEAQAVAAGIVDRDGDDIRLDRFHYAINHLPRTGGTITLPDGRTVTVTPVVWRARGYVRASDVSGIEQPDNLPLDNGMTTR
jgi:hypothetical protein